MSITHLEEAELVWGVWRTYNNGADVANVDISTGNCYSCSGVGSARAFQVWGGVCIEYRNWGDSVQRSFDFWMPLSSYVNCQFWSPQKRQEPKASRRGRGGGFVHTYLGDANDSVV